MKKYLIDIEAAIAHKNFPFCVLAGVGVLLMPHGWYPLVIGAITVSVIYGYLKRNPGTLKDQDWWKRPEVQRLGILGVAWGWWIILISAFHGNLHGWFPIFDPGIFALIFAPLFVYLLCATHAIATWPKGAAVSGQPADRKKLQNWTDTTLAGFLVAFIFSVTSVIWFPGGVGSWLNGWLLASARTAELSMSAFTVKEIQLYGNSQHLNVVVVPAPADQFSNLVNAVFAMVLIVLLWPGASRLAGFLTTWLRRMDGRITVDFYEAFLRTMRTAKTQLTLKENNRFSKNVASSFLWLLVCYSFLFALVGLSTGPLGEAIVNWLNCSIADANTGMLYGATANPKLRLFCAAIVALYGTVPLAVTGSVFLPYLRRRQLFLNTDGVFFPDGPYFALGFRTMRLWSDFASIDLNKLTRSGSRLKGTLLIKFHTGGKLFLKLSQLSKADLEKFLAAVDENALECRVSNQVIELRASLREENAGLQNKCELGTLSAQQFQSTIFVPHQQGSWLPDGETRVVRLLASRPLSCVYLVRCESTGKLAIAKHFFLAEDNEETQALRKCFEREYELLRQIDHAAVSKVLGVFHRDQSTYLMIEHAYGMDLRTLVTEQGPRSEEKVIAWALQICEIMTYLHSQKPPIIHRDLSPDNIVLTDNGSVRVIDFGAAHQFLEGITGTIIGKQCYVSPEQLQGRAGSVSDVYSFGCMLHFLLSGEEPVALTQCDPSTKAPVSPYFNALVMACTEFDQELRPQSFSDVKERLIIAREKPVHDVVARLKEVAEIQGVPIGCESITESVVLSTEAELSSVIEIRDYQEQLR